MYRIIQYSGRYVKHMFAKIYSIFRILIDDYFQDILNYDILLSCGTHVGRIPFVTAWNILFLNP